MRPAPALLIAIATLAPVADASAHAQVVAPPEAETAVAEAVAAVLPALDQPWRLEWSPFGAYAGRRIHWHLAGPATAMHDPAASPAITHRRGWLEARGGSVAVSICGDEARVGAMTLETADIWLGDGDLTAELQAFGLTLRPVVTDGGARARFPAKEAAEADPAWSRRASRLPASSTYALQSPDREPALLTAVYRCTPPGTRHATRCEMTWTVQFRAAERPRAEPCLAPAHPQSAVSLD